MNFKLIKIYVTFLAIETVFARSFTIILDTTVSMQEEVDIIKSNMVSVANVLKKSSDYENFIVVPFNDPGVGWPMISAGPDQMVESLGGVTVNGGKECPEDSLAGIEKGLEISKPESLIYVFTDAYSNNNNKFRNIETLCRNSRSQVVIFLSGSCSGAEAWQQGDLEVYYDIARSCSGAVFRFDAAHLWKAFKYIEEMIASEWNDIESHEAFTGFKQFKVKASTFTKDFLIAVSGNFSALQLTDAQGISPQINKVVDTRQSLVIRVVNVIPGDYHINIRCESATSMTFYKKTLLPFEYGFSVHQPRSIRETSLRPMPGWLNYILIVLSPGYNIQITTVELHMTDGSDKKSLNMTENETRHGHYISSVFMEPDKSFRCVIYGRDTITNEDVTGATKVVNVQTSVQQATWLKPTVEIIDILDNDLVDFGTDTTFACKVKGYPKPKIQWQIDPESLLTTEEILLEMPSTYINYVTLNATSNSTISCKATNAKGDEEQSMALFVNRTLTFEVIQTPEDTSFEYGTEGKLYCKVEAYPEVEIKWFHNDSLIEYSDNIEVASEENALVIKNMTLNEGGSYKCEVENSVRKETFTAEVTISGLEAPEVDIESAEIILQPRDWKEIECSIVKGVPRPQITWSYKKHENDEFNSVMPDEVYVEADKLKIIGKKEHTGTYKCAASNIVGEAYREVAVIIQYAPKISNTHDGILSVMETHLVELTCDVDAIPRATVRWELTQDDVIVPLDNRHTTNDRNTHRFYALWRDSGIYHCIAENDKGKVEKTVTVNVLVPPFIEPSISREIGVPAGSNVSLSCNVLYGNPAPTTLWEFIAEDSTSSVLLRGNSQTTRLDLTNVSRANEGQYLCIADNSVGNDRIKVNIKINDSNLFLV